jgi:cytochrome c oxidase assembly factor CtaG
MIPGLPFTWHIAAMVVLVMTYLLFRLMGLDRRHHVEVVCALIAAAAVVLWPMGDLARSVSLSAAVVQRLVLMLLCVPLLLRAIPVSTMERITRPFIIDRLTYFFSRPVIAILFVTLIGTATLVPATVDWGATSWIGNVTILFATVVAATIMWVPALGLLPGSRRLSPFGRAAYVFISSLVVTSLSLVWILSRHVLYPSLSGQVTILGMSPLLDQQLAGFIAKLGAYAPLWAIAFYIFAHAEDEGLPVEETPLHWADVERELLRIDRHRERTAKRHQLH